MYRIKNKGPPHLQPGLSHTSMHACCNDFQMFLLAACTHRSEVTTHSYSVLCTQPHENNDIDFITKSQNVCVIDCLCSLYVYYGESTGNSVV